MHDIKEHGYIQLDNVLNKDEVARMAKLVQSLVDRDWPAPFAAVYDQFWQLLQRCGQPAAHIFGADYRLMPNFWVSHVLASSEGRGWTPHRDRPYVNTLKGDGLPLTMRLWVPLTDATTKNSCIGVVPADLDPDYPNDLKNKTVHNPQHAKILPAGAGSILAWNEALLHWGTSADEDAEHPRISMAFTVQANFSAFEGPLLDPLVTPGFKHRLGLIGHMLKRYENREPQPITKATWDVAMQLSGLCDPVGRCQCSTCFPHPEQALLVDSTDQPKSFYRALVEASRLADTVMHERGLGNISKADNLATIALDMLGLTADADFVEVIETQFLHALDPANVVKTAANESAAAASTTPVAGAGPQSQKESDLSAEAELDQFLAVLVKALGPQHTKVKDTLHRLVARGECWPSSYYPNLAPAFRHLIRVRELELGTNHPEIADRLVQFAAFLENHNYLDQALPLFRRAIEIRQQKLGPSFASQLAYAHCLYRLGNVYMKKSDFVNAEEPFTKAHEVLVKLNCGGTLAVHVHHGLGTRLQQVGQRKPAEWHLYKSIELGLPVPNTHILIRDSALKLGQLYLLEDRINDATALFEHNIYPDWYKLALPPQERGSDVQDTAINRTSNPYAAVVNQMRKKFSPPDLCMTARQALVRRYSWAVPNDEALAAIAQFAPVVEVAAGSGYWAALLKARGVDIIAYDGAPMEMGGSVYTIPGTSWTEVKQGDEKVGQNHPDRSLMLCWPPQANPMALDAVNAYTGNCVIYIGEARGGKTGDDAFQDLLENDWKKVRHVELFNWHTSSDGVHIYKRKKELPIPKQAKQNK